MVEVIGIVIAFLTLTVWSLSDWHYLVFAVALVIVVVAAYSYCGGTADACRQRASASVPTDPQAPRSQQDKQHSAPVPHFRERCQCVAAKFELTPRETEVFILLAKGRNAEYISNELVVSASTVKSHIYHIYRKIGINSQQALINIVERARPTE